VTYAGWRDLVRSAYIHSPRIGRRGGYGQIIANLGRKGITQAIYSPDEQNESALARPILRHLFCWDLADAGNSFERHLATF
jgi:hypothetical protein